MHKNFRSFGNFVLSLSAIRASIFLHVKAPENGGCGPLRGLRFPEVRSGGSSNLRVLDPNRAQRSRRSSGSFRSLWIRPSGPVRGMQRPSGRGSIDDGIPSGVLLAGGTHRSQSGDGRLLRRLSVRHQEAGCPADPDSWTEGAGRFSTLHFPAAAAPLPRVGEPADPGPRSFARGRAGSHRPKEAPARSPRRPGRQSRKRRRSGDLQRWEVGFGLPPVRTGSFGISPEPRGRSDDLEEAPPSRGCRDRTSERTDRGSAGPTG